MSHVLLTKVCMETGNACEVGRFATVKEAARHAQQLILKKLERHPDIPKEEHQLFLMGLCMPGYYFSMRLGENVGDGDQCAA